jgi:hypothetical protein
VYVCHVQLGSQWEALDRSWSEARIRVVLDESGSTERAAQLLAPLQPFRAGAEVLIFRAVGRAESVRRLLDRLDEEHIRATLEVISSDPIPDSPPEPEEPTIRESWEAALRTIPADWSDLLAEVELRSSDWIEQAAVEMVPLNPLRVGDELVLRFRAARRFGYGASPQMVARCLSRCDERGMRGEVRILRVLSDTRPIHTQGPVWQLDGRTV